MKLAEYVGYDATGLAELVARGDVSPVELLDLALTAVEQVNPALNAVVHTFPEEARRFIDEDLRAGPFRGVPFLLKDLTQNYAGQPTGAGTPLRNGHQPAEDTELVRRYKSAGFVTFGKTAVPELAMDWTTRSRLHGETNNPWNTAHTAGTSSGGTAAAVAAGIVPAAHGNDGGGSIRVPASCCGVFGLKPSRGRNPAAPAGETWDGMLVEHVLTRSVRDSAAILDATAGPTAGQFYNSPSGGNFVTELRRDPGRLRIGVLTDAPYGAPTDGDCLAAVEDATRLLNSLGHDCAPASLQLPENGWPGFEAYILTEYAADMRVEAAQLGRALTEADFPATLNEMIAAGNALSAVDQRMATAAVHGVAQAVNRMFDGFDVILSPTLARPPLRHDEFPHDVDMREHYRFYLSWMPYTHIYNISGAPAISVPLHWNAAGLPVGVQFAAAPAREDLLIRLGSQLETARPWWNRRPAVFAT
ncbi:amidase [Pseudomonas sp. GX19020]|uniref:amidase n=1 Tax=Pseudomonas sp. GX19020 TaxID=2942277 RepID=UPI002019D610|nr:amidase [Pseudomonas sp. GX19020]